MFPGKVLMSDPTEETFDDMCQGVRCGRGKCVPLRYMCDGVNHCEDGNDESENACTNKRFVCSNDPFVYGCGMFKLKYDTFYVYHITYSVKILD